MTVSIPEDERQAILLALAALSLERPGWFDYLKRIAARYDGEAMFIDFRETSERWPTGPRAPK